MSRDPEITAFGLQLGRMLVHGVLRKEFSLPNRGDRLIDAVDYYRDKFRYDLRTVRAYGNVYVIRVK